MLRPGKKFYKRPSLIAATVVLLIAFLTVPTALVLTARAGTKAAPTPLHKAAADGDIEQVKSLISKGGDVNAKSGKGWPYTAAWSGYYAQIQKPGGGWTPLEGWTPLHTAAWYGRKDVAEVRARLHYTWPRITGRGI